MGLLAAPHLRWNPPRLSSELREYLTHQKGLSRGKGGDWGRTFTEWGSWQTGETARGDWLRRGCGELIMSKWIGQADCGHGRATPEAGEDFSDYCGLFSDGDGSHRSHAPRADKGIDLAHLLDEPCSCALRERGYDLINFLEVRWLLPLDLPHSGYAP
jgi:hypothetical protein